MPLGKLVYFLTASSPFVSHDPELSIILKGNITLSAEKSKELQKVCIILMPECFYTCIQVGDSTLLVCYQKEQQATV